MSFAILGLGKAVPPARMTQPEAKRIAQVLCCRSNEQMTWLPLMYEQTGIERRHIALGASLIRDLLDGTRHSGSVFLPKDAADDRGPTTAERMELYAQLAGPLAVEASRQALAEASWKAEQITHLVTVSCTGFCAPGVDLTLIQQLGMRRTVQRTHVGFMGCHGAINGLRVASAYAGADPGARVLLCAVELSSLHYHFGWDPQKIVANALFGDGAVAVAGMAEPATPDAWSVAATGSCVLPNSTEAMSWSIGDHGFDMTLSKQVPGLIARNVRPWLVEWLGGFGLRLEDVRSWAIHPGGPRILSAVEEALGLAPAQTSASREVLAACGNMSSPTVLFIVDQLRARRAPRPALAMAFGPGLVAEAALFG
jgi:alpha-pyrone synthase